MTLRTRAELMAVLDGFELVAPGLVDISRWRPETEPGREAGAYGAVGLLVS